MILLKWETVSWEHFPVLLYALGNFTEVNPSGTFPARQAFIEIKTKTASF